MVRETTPFTQGKMDTDLATEPLIVLKISWKIGDIFYSDKDVGLLGAEGRIMDFSGISSDLKANNVGIVTSSSFTLSDFDGALKDLYDDDIMEFLPCEVFFGYQGGGISDLMLLYKGRVGTPITWDEGERLLTFDVISNYKDSLVGDLVTSDDYDSVFFDTSSEGRMKPMSFGTPVQVEAVRVTTIPFGSILGQGSGGSILGSFTFEEILDPFEIVIEGGENFPQTLDGFIIQLRIGELKGFGDWIAEVRGGFSDGGALKGNIFNVTSKTINPDLTTKEGDDLIPIQGGKIIIEENSQVYLTLYSENGGPDILAREIYLINDQDHIDFLPGTPSDIYDYDIREVWGEWDNPNNVIVVNKIKTIPSEWYVIGNAGEVVSTVNPGQHTKILGTLAYPSSQGIYLAMERPLVERPIWPRSFVKNSIKAGKDGVGYGATSKESFYTGKIFITLRVTALGQTDNTVNEFPNLLNPTQPGTGPLIEIGTTNTMEVLDFLFTNHSTLVPDFDSFTDIKAKINKYENHFTIAEQADVLTISEAIGFQARVGLNFDGTNVKAVYLSEETKPVLDIDEKEISSKTMVLESISITELKTLFRGEWQGANSIDDKETRSLDKKGGVRSDKNILKESSETHLENDDKFGIQSQVVNFFIYSFGQTFIINGNPILNTSVRKSVDFWGHRFANSWRIVNVTNFQNTMKLEIFDIVRFIATTGGVNVSGVSGGGLSNISKLLNTDTGGVKGIVIGTKQNATSDTVDLKVMLESVQGELSGSGEALIDADFWVSDENDVISQGPPVAR